MKISPSVKVAALGLGVLAAVYAGWRAWSFSQLEGYEPSPVRPGRVNLIAVKPTAGYRIVVSNGIAHLVKVDESSQGFGAPESADRVQADSPRLPIRETLQSLQGDEQALGRLVMAVNRIKEDDLPPVRTVWRAEEIVAALEGDAEARERLERVLHTSLDGSPRDELDFNALVNGIVIDSPVPVEVTVGGERRRLVGRIQEPFKTAFAQAVENRVMERFNPRPEVIVGTYRQEALAVLGPEGRRQDVAAALRAKVDPNRLAGLAGTVDRILTAVQVVATDAHVASASSESYEGPNREPMADLRLGLTEEGRMRLWKYSHDVLQDGSFDWLQPGRRARTTFQLLLTMDGVAIAAPRIRTELSGRDVRLARIPSESLVEEAVKLLGEIASGKENP